MQKIKTNKEWLEQERINRRAECSLYGVAIKDLPPEVRRGKIELHRQTDISRTRGGHQRGKLYTNRPK